MLYKNKLRILNKKKALGWMMTMTLIPDLFNSVE